VKLKQILFVLLIFNFYISVAQNIKQEKYEPDDAQEQQTYDREFTYGINWNTYGGIVGGINLKYAWQTTSNQLIYNLIGLEIVHVVHPKERLTSPSSTFGSAYILNKSANMFVIRPHIGREWVIFKKAEEEGIQVSCLVAGGPSLAYLKPYYVIYETEIKEGNTVVGYNYESAKFQESNEKLVAGAGSIFAGFDQMKALLGIHAKASLNFEYGRFQSSVAGVEIGAMFEYFPSKPILLPQAQNPNFFPSLFLNLYFGIR